MNNYLPDHATVSDLLPFYTAGSLSVDERHQVERHLVECDECRGDLAFWMATASAVLVEAQNLPAPPSQVFAGAISQLRTSRRFTQPFERAYLLLISQARMIRGEIWPASAAIFIIGLLAALLGPSSGVIWGLAPLVAAATISVICGPGNDPALELVMTTPTSPRLVLLARLALVFSYNLVLALGASLCFSAIRSFDLFWSLTFAWLGPMTFLSALALVLSLWIGSGNSAAVCALAWMADWIAGSTLSNNYDQILTPLIGWAMPGYHQFWENTPLLFAAAIPLVGLAVWLSGRTERSLVSPV